MTRYPLSLLLILAIATAACALLWIETTPILGHGALAISAVALKDFAFALAHEVSAFLHDLDDA